MVNQETGARIETNFNINEINRSAYSSAVTDGTKLYLIGGTTSEDYYVNKIWVADVSDYSYNSYTIPIPENELSILATIDSTGMNIVDDKRFSIKITILSEKFFMKIMEI